MSYVAVHSELCIVAFNFINVTTNGTPAYIPSNGDAVYDPRGLWSEGGNMLTVKTPGFYMAHFEAAMSGSQGNICAFSIRKGTSSILGRHGDTQHSGHNRSPDLNHYAKTSISCGGVLVAGETIQVWVEPPNTGVITGFGSLIVYRVPELVP